LRGREQRGQDDRGAALTQTLNDRAPLETALVVVEVRERQAAVARDAEQRKISGQVTLGARVGVQDEGGTVVRQQACEDEAQRAAVKSTDTGTIRRRLDVDRKQRVPLRRRAQGLVSHSS
jgi:hypothetical protein